MDQGKRVGLFVGLVFLSATMFSACGEDAYERVPWELYEFERCDEGTPARPCYTGPDGTLRVGACKAGTQACENGYWRECTGEVVPGEEICNYEDDDCDGEVDERVALTCGLCPVDASPDEICGNDVDDDCDGEVDEGCVCEGGPKPCYAGPPETRNVGSCKDGFQRCEGSTYGACLGAVQPVSEVCADGVDNDCDGEIDEGCPACVGTRQFSGQTRWQIHEGRGPVCWDYTYERNGGPESYLMARIPPYDAPEWRPMEAERISFNSRSTLCGADEPVCACKRGGEYTYFQTFLTLSQAQTINTFRLDVSTVDDGVQVTIFNSRFPQGVVDVNAYAYLGGGSTENLAEYLTNGSNRIVLTHVDDCCMTRSLEGVRVILDGVEVVDCK